MNDTCKPVPRAIELHDPAPIDMPDWWPEDRPPERLNDNNIYLGKGGVWRHTDGRIANRAERRRAGVK